jgi:formylglycine-generating enzyme required for sulfatase activity
MGSPPGERGRYVDAGPQHQVQLTQGFWLFDTPCTQALWQAVMGTNPSRFTGEQRPVENVSWDDCQQFLVTFNQQFPELSLVLPTEAQWEYACRAGTQTARYEGRLDSIAWYSTNSNNETHVVEQRRPNAWGLYDMLGNMWEWCHDGLRTYDRQEIVDPMGPLDAGAFRVIRGGSWGDPAPLVRAAYRFGYRPGFRYVNLGFRCASSGMSA